MCECVRDIGLIENNDNVLEILSVCELVREISRFNQAYETNDVTTKDDSGLMYIHGHHFGS